MKQITVDSSLNKLSTEALTVQIGSAELTLISFFVVLSFYGESLGGRGLVTVLTTIALQVLLDRARGELPSDARTLIFHWEVFRGKIGEIWRSGIAIFTLCLPFLKHSLKFLSNIDVSPHKFFIPSYCGVLSYHV